ncbi:hypothetical protein D8780_14245 [Notoacmeibacter ruber]|uniref:DUF4410 domain-containing protein n=2 Tax=Notoacmeibacter ruber TaxID=2670375 RepID=A0A3L7JFH7_9HYPH|nr:hypothetical protein D8780_14245 [Notoacmeibacter ruber]
MAPLRTFAAAMIALMGLAGCQSQSAYKPAGDYYFSSVDVSKPAQGGSPAVARMTEDGLRQAVAGQPEKGASKRLAVEITEVHFKNPVVSLIAGDGNRMQSTATISDEATGETEWQQRFTTADTSSYVLNGVAGLAVSALQNKSRVEAELARKAAETIGSKALGGVPVKLPKMTAPEPITDEPAAVTQPMAPRTEPASDRRDPLPVS